MPAEDKNPDEGQNSSLQPGKGTIRLRLSSILAIIALALGAVVLAYVAGVMSGRNTVREPVPMGENQTPKPPSSLPAPEKDNNILAAEDLEFARVLRGKAPRVASKQTSTPQPDPQETDTKTSSPAVETKEENIQVEKVPENKASMSDYIFQIAAFRDDGSADNLRQKLEGYGFRTRLERNGKLYVVLIALRGTEERAQDVKAIARELKLGEPVLRERKDAANKDDLAN